MANILLVMRGKAKRKTPCYAKDLYLGTPFALKRRLAVRFDRWYILSAKYGLLEPMRIIAPYDQLLSSEDDPEGWKAWSESTAKALLDVTDEKDVSWSCAGPDYYTGLHAALRGRRPFRVLMGNRPAGLYEMLIRMKQLLTAEDLWAESATPEEMYAKKRKKPSRRPSGSTGADESRGMKDGPK